MLSSADVERMVMLFPHEKMIRKLVTLGKKKPTKKHQSRDDRVRVAQRCARRMGERQKEQHRWRPHPRVVRGVREGSDGHETLLPCRAQMESLWTDVNKGRDRNLAGQPPVTQDEEVLKTCWTMQCPWITALGDALRNVFGGWISCQVFLPQKEEDRRKL